MSDAKKVRIELTAEQKEELKKMTGKDAEALAVTAQELEDRIAPIRPVLG
jgi:mRNA-degrading endonuclease RelE of RelBE toxin-antitoxin system